jgi:hypothetical protein
MTAENTNIQDLAVEQIVSLLKSKGAEVETSTNRFGDPMFGIRSKHSYHWFSKCNHTGSIFCEHTYSTNTGRTKAGLRHRIKTIYSIQKKYSIEWN